MTIGRRRTQAERTSIARASLIHSAIVLLSEQGFAKATTSAIAQDAGVTTGALHHHFPTKESLLFAVLDSLTDDALTCFRALGDLEEEGDGVARAVVTSLWTYYGNRRYWAVWEINLGFRPDSSLYTALMENRARTRQRMHNAIEENGALKEGTRKALRLVLPFLLSSMRGIFLDTFFSGPAAESTDQQLEYLINTINHELRSPTRSILPD